MSTLDQLICSYRNGCPDAEGEILSEMLPDIEKVAAGYRFSGADIDDLISDGMLGVLRAIRKDNGKKAASFRTFAIVCAKNAMISRLRKKASSPESGVDFWDMIAGESAAERPETLDELSEFSEVSSVAAHAVKDLPEDQQKMILMTARGAKPDDIAEEIGCTTAELKERMSRAVSFLVFEIQMECPEASEKLARYCNGVAGNPDKPLLRLMK